MKALSLFTGIGGIDLALESEGIEIVQMCEIDPFCRSILNKRFPDVPIHNDIKTLDGSKFLGIDILVGGFPCQPFSTGGRQKGKEDARYLWDEMCRIIRQSRPNWVIGENVKGLLSNGIEEVESDLRSEGYETRTYLLSANDVDASHGRERVFIIGCKKDRSSTNTSTDGLYRCEVGTGDSQVDARSTERKNQDQCFERCSGVRSVLPFRNIKEEWGTEPDIRRVYDGVSRELDKSRIKALGNAVVPQQVLPFVKAIVAVENCTDDDIGDVNPFDI